jgi:predicted cupin superfamily sugar epimerase
MNDQARRIIEHLNLQPHPAEGGWFNETYRSSEQLQPGQLPERYSGTRSISTCIYYMLTPDTFSAMHRLASDEIFHFYLGDPVEMLQISPDGNHEIITIGSDLFNGMEPQVVVPAGYWQGSRLKPGGSFALLGTTVAPGFDFIDFDDGTREELTAIYPACAEMITALTRI